MRARSAFAVPLLAAAAAWACSGPGAMAVILRNERLGWLLFGVTAAVLGVGAVLLRRLGASPRRVGLLAVPLLVHPGWWMSARGGDCGFMLALGARAMTAVAALVVAVALVAAAVRRRRRGT
jgi:hypothetical protein